MPTSETDIAWAAGLFEGEGFLVSRRAGRRDYHAKNPRHSDIQARYRARLRAARAGVIQGTRPGGNLR